MANLRETRDFKVLTHSKDTGGTYGEIMLFIQPGGGPPWHTHQNETEEFHVQEGRFRLSVEGQADIELGPNRETTAPRGVPHRFENIGETLGVIVITVRPGGLEEYFEELEGVRLRLTGDEQLAAVEAIDQKYGIIIDRRSTSATQDVPKEN